MNTSKHNLYVLFNVVHVWTVKIEECNFVFQVLNETYRYLMVLVNFVDKTSGPQ
jgi:hypothetical protein